MIGSKQRYKRARFLSVLYYIVHLGKIMEMRDNSKAPFWSSEHLEVTGIAPVTWVTGLLVSWVFKTIVCYFSLYFDP